MIKFYDQEQCHVLPLDLFNHLSRITIILVIATDLIRVRHWRSKWKTAKYQLHLDFIVSLIRKLSSIDDNLSHWDEWVEKVKRQRRKRRLLEGF